jgi:hypothetical protein
VQFDDEAQHVSPVADWLPQTTPLQSGLTQGAHEVPRDDQPLEVQL